MARKSNKNLSVSSRKNKTKRSKSRRKNKTRLVIEGLCKGINDFSYKRSKLLRDLQGDGKESKYRKDDDYGIGDEISEKKEFVEPMRIANYDTEKKEITLKTEKEYLKQLEEERGKIYGDPFLSHQAIGLVWEGIFRNRYHELSKITQHGMGLSIPQFGKLFPADLVAEFLAGLKLARLTRPIFKQDSADDLKVFVSFSERFRKK